MNTAVERFLHQINRVVRAGDTRLFDRVHSSGEFASILNRERDRADRTGQEFSLVVYEVASGSRRSAPTRRLVSTLLQRIRSTDDIGWLEDGNLAAVLPHTTPDGAWKFVDTVRQAFDGDVPPPDCMVYAYPTWWLGTAGAGPGNAPPPDNKATPPPADPSRSGMQYSRAEGADRARPVEELDSNFLRRIPFGKRAADIVGSLVALFLLSPLLFLVALFIRIVSPGPAFFRQERVGYLGRTFTIWKFRTMHVNADTGVHRSYLRDLIHNEKEMTKLDNGRDNRIIPFGNVLRATGIDELPQLLNVLQGDMSLIGPRPCIPYEAREYAPWQMRRFDTVPGLTGLWQVSGKNRTTFKEMMRLDIGYARRRAPLLDAKIILLTPLAIARQVADRPSAAGARELGVSVVLRAGAVILAILSLNSLRK
jgi:lipopolysaccharide/colanic/teichoic acid biosynthesis glycosyltransferase